MDLKRELIRGAGPMAVLQLLQHEEMYGYQLADSMAKGSGGILAMGQSTLYPLLYTLESKKFVASRWVQLPSGRKRRYYRITDEGIAFLTERRMEWQELFHAMIRLGLVVPIPQEA